MDNLKKQKQFEQLCLTNDNLGKSDPELMQIWSNFAFDEVINQNDLDAKSRALALLATLIACQSPSVFKAILKSTLNVELSPYEVREVIYQASDYLGIARIYDFITIMNDIFSEFKIELPLKDTATVNEKIAYRLGFKPNVISLVSRCAISSPMPRKTSDISIFG